jgi:glutathione S-transferase/autophagy-related protein 2
LIYLSEKYGWTDLFPADIKTRAKIHQYLHWHHTNARLLTPRVLVPLIHSKVNALTPEDEEHLKNIDALLTKTTALLETFLVKDYIAETDAPTIADYAAYCEFGQTELMGVFDFSKYPKVAAWLKRMKVGLSAHSWHSFFCVCNVDLESVATTNNALNLMMLTKPTGCSLPR